MLELDPIRLATVEVAKRYEAMLYENFENSFGDWRKNPAVDKDGLLWLCQTIIADAADLPIDKMNRWIGFIQGQLAAVGNVSVTTERNVTRPIFHKAYADAGIEIPPTRERPKSRAENDALLELTKYGKRFPLEWEGDMQQVLVPQISAERHHILRRSNMRGHITTSALIFNKERTKIFMIYHNAFQMWLCPGGHFENDATLLASAMREAFEETGLSVTPDPFEDGSALINIDSHWVPARGDKGEGPHIHHDHMFRFTADETATSTLQIEEVTGGKWVPIAELESLSNPQIVGLLPKIRQIVT